MFDCADHRGRSFSHGRVLWVKPKEGTEMSKKVKGGKLARKGDYRTVTLDSAGHWRVRKSTTLKAARRKLRKAAAKQPYIVGVVFAATYTPVMRRVRVRVLCVEFGAYTDQEFGGIFVPRAIRVVNHPCAQ